MSAGSSAGNIEKIHRLTAQLVALALVTSGLSICVAVALVVPWLHEMRSASAPVQPAPTAGPSTRVVIARLPGGPTEWRSYMSAVGAITRTTGKPAELVYARSTEELRRLFFEEENAYFFSTTYGYVYATAQGLSPRLVAAPQVDGWRSEASCVVVSATSDYASIEELRGGRVGVSDSTSLGGSVYLSYVVREAGFGSLEQFFGPVDAGRSQDANLRDVLSGDLDVTVVNRSQLAPYPPDAFRVIICSPEYGMPPILAAQGVSANEVQAVSAAILALSRGSGLPETSAVEGFIVPAPPEYDFPMLLLPYVEGQL